MKKKIQHIFKSLKIFISYMICFVIGIFYTLYVDGSSGILLLYFIGLIPIISIVFMVIASKNIDISLKISNDTIKKNSNVEVTIFATKKISIFIPFVNISLGYSPHFDMDNNNYPTDDFPKLRFSMAYDRIFSYNYKFISKISGKGSIYINDAYIYDYLGFFRMKLKNVSSSIDVFITPDVKDITSSQILFNSICNNIITNDEEENSNDNGISVGSTLGYLHREYVLGDTPKRINWKLSCKKNKLMVRLDEPSPQSKPCFLIDMSINKDNPNLYTNLINFQTLIESSLSLLNMCVKYGIECECILCNCDNSTKYIVSSIDDIYSLAVMICHNTENGNHMLPNEVSNVKNSESMYLLFTDFYNSELKSQIRYIKQNGINANVILSPQYYGRFSASNIWIVNKDLSIAPSGF